MADAEEKFKKLLAKQSKTLRNAVVEYRRRYGREPPKGFGDWWKFAQENHFKLVDEFDTIHEDLAPFWNISSIEFRRRAAQVGELPSIDLVRITDGKAEGFSVDRTAREGGARSHGFITLLQKFQDKLPNMYFAINANAEGRVVVPWEHRHYPNMTVQDSSGGIATVVGPDFTTPDWQGQGSVWDAYRRTCPPDSEARRLYMSFRNPDAQSTKVFFGSGQPLGDDFTFVPTVEDSIDYCSKPWTHYTQGHFFSDWRTIPALLPVLSPGKATGFSDIRIPSHYYLGQSNRYTYGFDFPNEAKDIDDMEVPWEEKLDLIFWRGADTGGGSTPAGFADHYQRHRFLRMTHEGAEGNRTIIHADPSNSGHFIATAVPAGKLNSDIMDTAFTASTGAYPGGEDALRKAHRFAPAVPLGQHWAYRYLIDLDGMAYSGRFLALLSSESAVIKSTIWREFFSDWLQPWLHYIPLSSSYAEIYNIHAFYSGPTPSTLEAANLTAKHTMRSSEGDRHLQRIARAGRQWKKTIGRTVDMEVYVYRLCLEYGRLWADDRDSMNFAL
ncbi:glycosyltransferase family 90 protein [Rhizopogon vinicolor AM-OR11-026]|uniref:Glycosyltransferase family 90 protein n=1 Tax=Rhizopogon vinicolor AM-OR11-026 TaxID=1314800 RepID=A0A1B7MV47_9AGAM|nr:glycosyltransferase family 90 protein [Rhizopogon vinicolor AM-OR11-026]